MTRAELHELVNGLPEDAIAGAAVLLRCIVEGRIDPDQAWLWTPEWQRGECEAHADIAAGKGQLYSSDDEFVAALVGRGL